MTDIHITRLDNGKDLPLPEYATKHSAGMDVSAAVVEDVVLAPMQRMLIPAGFAMELPIGYEAQIRPRSGLAYKHGVTVLNSPGTIDADYRGEIKVLLINLGQEPFTISHGDRIAQMIITTASHIKWQKVSSIQDTERGDGGFGSTGSKVNIDGAFES